MILSVRSGSGEVKRSITYRATLLMLMVNLTLIDLLIGRHSSPILLDIYLLFGVSRVRLEDCSVFSKEHIFILS